MAHVQLHELFCTRLKALSWYGVTRSCLFPYFLCELNQTFRSFTDVDRRAGCFRRVIAVTVSDGSFVLAASLDVCADGLFCPAETDEARTEVGYAQETSMAHIKRLA
jgi:hypothetical protein